ncbi:transmembrane protein, putative (macronuclear) [Tetrahymena thermophila SB210]|uniref:Transmembrane protein, putative n=1 Tax=Tetrahymena thermophila (strain SB210) TaxID=312017 RepID=Q24HJ1_TETTS|nr:transmembrane protein, putative [Tetrahymena thermophila SB210]EAS07240.1 transmembrane protein, putative [Tetrahymena thermophila SB210]|eukprot:XP_001027482.1 transmembrane protein, putative [Tetrahymena thermophila SB210]
MFSFLDLFGIPVQMMLSKNQKHKTAFGSLVTIIIVSIVCIYSFYILDQCFQYSNPNIVSQDYLVQQPDEVVFDQKKYTLAMGIQDQNLAHFLDESIYYLEVQLLETTKTYNETTNLYDQKTVAESIKMERCTLDHFQVNQTVDYFKQLKFSNIYCFPLNFKMNLAGQFGAMQYKRLYIQVKSCEINCQNQTVIQQKLSDVAFQLYYVNYIISPNDLNNPFKPIGQNTFWQSGYSLFKNINVYFRKNTIRTDYGLISQEFQDDYRMIYSNDRETLIKKTDNKLYEIYIGLEKNKQSEYIRTYLKLFSAISQIGGIYNIFFLLGALICFPIQKISLYYKLIKSLYDFKKNREEIRFQFLSDQDSISGDNQSLNQKLIYPTFQNIQSFNLEKKIIENDYAILNSFKASSNKKQKINIPYVSKNKIKHKIQLENSEVTIQQPHSCLINALNIEGFQEKNCNLRQKQYQQQQKFIKENQQNINYSSSIKYQLERIFAFLFQSSPNISFSIFKMVKSQIQRKINLENPYSKMINLSIESLKEQLDLSSILKKIQDIEKLKYLLLNQNQIKLFDSISKQTLYLSDFNNKNNESDQKNNNDKRIIGCESLSQQEQNQFHQQFFSQDKPKDEKQIGKEAKEAFKQIYQNGQPISIVDKKLLQLLTFGKINYDKEGDINQSNKNTYNTHQTFLFDPQVIDTNLEIQRQNISLNNEGKFSQIMFLK